MDTAIMGSIITSPQPVFLSSPVTVARIEFDNDNTYSLMGNGGLSLVPGGDPTPASKSTADRKNSSRTSTC
ncbi:MAG: hypothetical protein MK179_15255 [Pirellulaceae bacterium]|nr:hypothetical protein [Pirellulaceae bacterium]